MILLIVTGIIIIFTHYETIAILIGFFLLFLHKFLLFMPSSGLFLHHFIVDSFPSFYIIAFFFPLCCYYFYFILQFYFHHYDFIIFLIWFQYLFFIIDLLYTIHCYHLIIRTLICVDCLFTAFFIIFKANSTLLSLSRLHCLHLCAP